MEAAKRNQDGASTSTSQVTQEYVVRIPKTKKKCFNIMRFRHSQKVDVSKWNQAKMERENNLKEFKADEDMPKYGAGSEFGREQREESRRKKYGIVSKKYNPEEQPWILKLGGKGGKKFKGIREGGVTENASYYVFTQAADGTFEAFPVEEWYNFTPIQRYKALSAEEAEEEFGRRDKVLNFFTIMVKKRLQNESIEDDDDDEKKPGNKKKAKQQKDFKISDMDDSWALDSDDSDGDDDDERPAKKEPKKGGKKKTKKEKNSDDEAREESDEGDFDDKEVDYMTDSSSSGGEQEDEKNNREMKGVEDEDALRKLDNSDEEEEGEEENNKETEEKEETKEKPPVQKPKAKQKKSEGKGEKGDKDGSGESTSESSDSDFDDNKYNSAMFMQEAKKKNGSDNSGGSSRANTPTRNYGDGKGNQKGHKRKMADSAAANAKRLKMENQPGSSSLASTLDGITEDAVRRYLARKPMTASELLHKFKSKKTKMSSDQLVNKIAELLKKMDLVKNNVKGKMYLSLKT